MRWGNLYFYFFLLLTIVLPTVYNVYLLWIPPLKGKKKFFVFALEVCCIAFGFFCTAVFCSFSNIRLSDWHEQLYGAEIHSPILVESIPTFIVLIGISLVGYSLLKLIKAENMPPLCAVLCMAAIYLGCVECIIWCVQISKDAAGLYYVLPINLLLIFARAIRDVVWNRLQLQESVDKNDKFICRLLNNAKNWPWIALVFAAPLLGVLMMVLLLFGQKPDYIIRMWTETADWTFSTKIPPQNIFYDEHYLCTVADAASAAWEGISNGWNDFWSGW